MTVRDTLLETIDRDEADAKRRASDFASLATELVEQISASLAKLPAGDRIAERYSDLAGKAITRSLETSQQFAERQAKLQSWPLRVRDEKASV